MEPTPSPQHENEVVSADVRDVDTERVKMNRLTFFSCKEILLHTPSIVFNAAHLVKGCSSGNISLMDIKDIENTESVREESEEPVIQSALTQ